MMRVMWVCLIVLLLNGCYTTVQLTVTEPDAKIYVNGSPVATGSYRLQLRDGACAYVKVEKPMYLQEEREYCSGVSGKPRPPRTDVIKLYRDETYDASIQSDYANVDFEIVVSKKYSEEQAWKIINSVITNYFEDLVISSRESGYLLSTWQVQYFPRRTVRSRVIVRLSSTTPLAYKIKIQSQIAYKEKVSVKNDEEFHDWDRILKRYELIFGELKARLAEK